MNNNDNNLTNQTMSNTLVNQPNNNPISETTNTLEPTFSTQSVDATPFQQPVIQQPQPNNNPITEIPNTLSPTFSTQPVDATPFQQPVIQQPQPNNNPITETPNIQNVNQTQPNNTLITDEELLKEFIGNNYNKITTSPFNFAAFFFNSFYMFYRKMILYGLVLFIIEFIILNYVNNIIVYIILTILLGLFTNKIYLHYAKNKIKKIKYKNQEKDSNELKKICLKKGGTSIGKIFLGFLYLILTTIIGSLSNSVGEQ